MKRVILTSTDPVLSIPNIDALWRREPRGWRDQKAGRNGCAMTASAMRGIVNDVMAVYLADAAVASAFVA
jgi:hypothetical protein